MAYEPSPFVEPLGYQPVEFLDLPSMSDLEVRPVAPVPAPDSADDDRRFRPAVLPETVAEPARHELEAVMLATRAKGGGAT